MQERLGLPDDAAASYRKALELDPKSGAAHTNLGSSLARSGANAEAEQHFRAALEVDPKNAVAQQGLTKVLASGGRTDP